MVSALVLCLTGYGWATFNNLQTGLSTADVIGFSSPDGVTDILLVGMDSRTDAQGNPLPPDVLAKLRAGSSDGELNTDTMILVRIPNDGRSAVAYSLPRDMYVEMPDGFGEHKLNSAYTRGQGDAAQRLVDQGADPATVHNESVAAGRKMLIRTVEKLTGVGVDHYAEINLLGFSLLTNAVGGVDVCLKAPVSDNFSGAHFPAGVQTISGPDALAFVRQRHGLPRGDLDRVVRQQVFMAALAKKVLSAGTLANPAKVRDLVNATQQSLVLDDKLNVLDFASRMQNLAAGQIKFMTVPVVGDATSDSEGAVLKVDPEAVKSFIASTTGVQPPAAQPAPQRKISVDVLNASGVSGLAATVSHELTSKGFVQGMVGNADTRRSSVVRYSGGDQQAADTIAGAVGGLPKEEDPNLPGGTVQVYLGEDYKGSGPQGVAGPPLLRLDGRPAAGPAGGVGNVAATSPGAGSPHAAQPAPAPPPPDATVAAGSVRCVN
ncbi:MAG TPA: LCP family protein [Pseudonocardiaceae bacterium]|jgi:LCP family protein required for cell wall assembly